MDVDAQEDVVSYEEEEEQQDDEELEQTAADSEDEEYNLANFGISQALPVPEGPPPDLSAGPPQTAEEYLQWVRYEAQRRPNVVRADIDPRKVRSSAPSRSYFDCPTLEHACPDWAQPAPKWVTSFLLDFAQLRRNMQAMQEAHALELQHTRLPDIGDVQAWDELCFGQWQPLEQQQQQEEQQGQHAGEAAAAEPGAAGAAAAGGAAGSGEAETDRILGPVLRAALALDQLGASALLSRHVDQLQGAPSLTYLRSQWLFALAAVLPKPLPPDTAAAFRSLVRRCAALRASLASRLDPQLPRLNILLAVAGGYFGQEEGMAAHAAATGAELQ